MSGVDLGTWFVRVVLRDGRGFITKWETGARFLPGAPWDGSTVGLKATRQAPAWASEAELLASIEYQFMAGGFSCDCNLRSFLDDVAMVDDDERPEYPCGNLLEIATLDAIRPDGTEVRLLGTPEPLFGQRPKE
jgi:hypothetical protein